LRPLKISPHPRPLSQRRARGGRNMKKLIVAIDGPSGAGKSTVGKLLAKELGYLYIDTGAMYRAIGLKAGRLGIEFKEGPALRELCVGTEVRLEQADGGVRVYLDNEDVSTQIRTPEMGMAASAVSAQPCVRERLLELQRKLGEGGGVVLEGRDIGTVVFPGAEVKFYLDAKVEERAKRRWLEFQAKGMEADLQKTIEEVAKRDYDDSHREIAPLKKADDAIVVDSSGLGIDEVVALMKKKVQEVAAA
jgi:cytidylate kinase